MAVASRKSRRVSIEEAANTTLHNSTMTEIPCHRQHQTPSHPPWMMRAE